MTSEMGDGEYACNLSGSIVVLHIVHFREIGRLLHAERLAKLLTRLLEALDAGLCVYSLTGTAFADGRFMAMGARAQEHANDAVRFGLHCLRLASGMLVDAECPQHGTLAMRVAVHSGRVTIVHQRTTHRPPCFVGPTVDEAVSLSHHALAGEVCCSRATVCDLRLESYPSVVISAAESWNGEPSPKAGVRVLAPAPAAGHGFAACYMCPNTFHLTFQDGVRPQDNAIVPPSGFGFMPHELRHLRILWGPDTDSASLQTSAAETLRRLKRHSVTTTLYTRTTLPVRTTITFDYVPTTRQLAITFTTPAEGSARMTGVSTHEAPPLTQRSAT